MALSKPLISESVWFEAVVFFSRPLPSSRRQQHTKSREETAQIDAFEAFFRQHERQITGYLCRMLGNEQSALDFSQETFIRAWQHFDQLQEATTARAWLYRVATNLALRQLEQHSAHSLQPLDDTLPGDSDPGRRIVERDLVQQTLLTLTPKQRSALMLHEVQGFSCDDVGAILHMSRDAVKMALWRGREQFRKRYLHEEEQS